MTVPPDAASLLELAVATAREAAELVRQGRVAAADDVAVKSSPVDVVTAVDTASEHLVVGRLLGARPDDGVLGEEGAQRRGTSGVRWIVDPIDGTVNFLYGLRPTRSPSPRRSTAPWWRAWSSTPPPASCSPPWRVAAPTARRRPSRHRSGSPAAGRRRWS